MKDENLVLSLSLKERISCLEQSYTTVSYDFENEIMKWKKKFGDLNDEAIKRYLCAYDLNRTKLAIGIKDLNKKDIDKLYSFLIKQEWYCLHKKIFNAKIKQKNKKLDAFVEPYTEFLLKKLTTIKRKASFKIDESVIKSVSNQFTTEAMSLSIKTLIYDQEEQLSFDDQKDMHTADYICLRFSSKDKYIEFFNDYPVLARLLAIRVKFAYDNFENMIHSIESSKEECKRVFGIHDSFVLESLELCKGDSHSNGKTVALLQISDCKLVFKFKNLNVGNALNTIYKAIEFLDPTLKFYRIKRVARDNFTIESYVEHDECKKDIEVSKYYFRFGVQVLIAFLLRGTDFHYENIIAAGSMPVLIDVETLFQNDLPIENGKCAIDKYINIYKDSVAGTSLLPNATGARGKCDEFVELSGLAGDEQELSQKVLQLSNEGDKLHFIYGTGKLNSASNLPMLHGKKKTYHNYISDILTGFEHAYFLIFTHKGVVSKIIKKHFDGCLVRNVFRNTQNYADMLGYASHPSRMTNFLNREQLFINLWVINPNKLEILKYEQEDLLNNDIPIFYNIVNKKDVITSQNIKIEEVYKKDAMSMVMDRINLLSCEHFITQRNMLVKSLGVYDGKVNSFTLSNNHKMTSIDTSNVIANYICKKFIVGETNKDIGLETIFVNLSHIWKSNLMTRSFYDGLGGIYLFLYEANKISNNVYQNFLDILFGMFCDQLSDIKNNTQFNDAFSFLYTLIRKIRSEGKNSDIEIAKKQLTKIMNYYHEKHDTIPDDWLFGRAGLIHLCSRLYSLIGDKKILDNAIIIANDISVETEEFGFAHGLAGIVYGLISLLEVIDIKFSKSICTKIYSGYNTVICVLKAGKVNRISWCRGYIGIGYMMLKVWKNRNRLPECENSILSKSFIEKILRFEVSEDSLCHGAFGKIDFLITLKREYPVDKEVENAIDSYVKDFLNMKKNKYYLRGLLDEPMLDLMTGLAGIGYEYIRSEDTKMFSVLTLE